jgi:hypothetical protein
MEPPRDYDGRTFKVFPLGGPLERICNERGA